MQTATRGSQGTAASVARSGCARMSGKPCSKPAITLWRRSTVMIASTKPTPSWTAWSKASTGNVLAAADAVEVGVLEPHHADPGRAEV